MGLQVTEIEREEMSVRDASPKRKGGHRSLERTDDRLKVEWD